VVTNGATLRNWGIGLMVASLALEAIGGAMMGASDNPDVVEGGVAMSAVGGAMFLPGLVMLIWGQVRHIRAIEWQHRVRMWNHALGGAPAAAAVD
jgi:drug/metabolite transporter (DMT)-like permease